MVLLTGLGRESKNVSYIFFSLLLNVLISPCCEASALPLFYSCGDSHLHLSLLNNLTQKDQILSAVTPELPGMIFAEWDMGSTDFSNAFWAFLFVFHSGKI